MSIEMPVKRVVSYYARPTSARHGGVNRSRQQWMLALAEQGFDVVIVAAQGGFAEELVQHPRITHARVAHWGQGRMTMVPRSMGSMFRSGDLVYLHEGWTPSNIVAARYCVAHKIPFVVLPHGVYEPQIVDTLKHFPGRRRIERWVLEHAHAVHLFFPEEIGDLQKLAPRAASVVSMTGMAIPDAPWKAPVDATYVAWLGRYDVKHKGIDILFEALSRVPVRSRPTIEMRGPDYFGGEEETRSLVQRFGVGESVNVGPELRPDEVEAFLRGAQAFVHVPRWEAFGRTILESLALGVPVILGDGARVAAALRDASAALVVSSTDPGPLADVLSDEVPTGVGGVGRGWAEQHASWESAGKKLVDQLHIRAERE